MKNYSNLIFDLDGTLTNPYEGILNSLQYALQKLAFERIPEMVPDNFIGPPLQKGFKALYGLSDKNSEIATEYYREHYGKYGMYENIPYDGVQELLEGLSSSGRNLYIATSKYKVFAWEIVRHFELDRYFIDLQGPEKTGSHTKAELIRELIDKYRLDVENTVMIGDTHFDLAAANEVGIDCIAVTYGFGSRYTLSTYSPVAIVDDVYELGELLM